MTADMLADLVMDVIDDPETADANALLASASDFLDTVQAGDADLVPIARAMAYAAMDVAVFGRYHHVLRNRFRAFYMAYTAIIADA